MLRYFFDLIWTFFVTSVSRGASELQCLYRFEFKGFKSEHWLGFSRTLRATLSVVFLCVLSLLGWNLNLLPSLRSHELWLLLAAFSLSLSHRLECECCPSFGFSSLWTQHFTGEGSCCSRLLLRRPSSCSLLVVSYSWWSSLSSWGPFWCFNQCLNTILSQICTESCVDFHVSWIFCTTTVQSPSSRVKIVTGNSKESILIQFRVINKEKNFTEYQFSFKSQQNVAESTIAE